MLSKNQIKKKVMAYKWERWLERSFDAFMLSIFQEGISRQKMKRAGVDAEWPILLFQEGFWYYSYDALDDFYKKLNNYLSNGGSVFQIVKNCRGFHLASKKLINKTIKSNASLNKKTRIVKDILSQATSYIWLAHALGDIYFEIAKKQAGKIIKDSEVDKFIGDISFPAKKTAFGLMEYALKRGDDPKKVWSKYGWLKIRDGFSEGFTLDEVIDMKRNLKDKREEKFHVYIPPKLRKLARELQELVYFRTYRTDVFYELFYQARPILKELAKKHKIDFARLRHYSIIDLLRGETKFYPPKKTWVARKGLLFYFDEPIIRDAVVNTAEVRGNVAFKGIARGAVKVVKTVQELAKVLPGDILVTQMTFPSFISAMHRALAFVTDEGGLTCHAAIVAREMKKPCIIGTKNASEVFKDGDMVEVDANNGVARKI